MRCPERWRLALAAALTVAGVASAAPADVRESLAAAVPHPRRLGDPTEFAALAAHIVENAMLNGDS